MVDEWVNITVGELIQSHGGEIKTGPFGTKLKAAEYTPTGVPVISVGEVGYGRLQVHDKTPRVDAGVTDRMPEYVLRPGDIVFGRKGAVDRAAIVTDEQDGWFLGSDGIRLRLPQDRCDPRFIAYQLLEPSHRAWMLQHAAGTTMPSLNQGIIERIPLDLTSLGEQRAIADILGSLDDKIELNRRMNQTLEAMARAIFKSWFIDFDPVRAKVDGNNPPGLDPATAALFPDAFQDSPLGPIPQGWNVQPLSAHVEPVKGLSYQGKFLSSVGMPLHNLNSVREGGGYKHEGLKRYAGEYKERHLVQPGDLIVTNTEQGFDYLLIGYAAIVPKRYGDKGLFSHHLYRVRPLPKSHITPQFLYLLFRSQRMHDLVAGYTNGTTVNMLPPDGLQRPEFVVPPPLLIERFQEQVVPLLDKIEQLYDEGAVLAKTRDILLPKLLSGELRAGEAREVAEEIV